MISLSLFTAQHIALQFLIYQDALQCYVFLSDKTLANNCSKVTNRLVVVAELRRDTIETGNVTMRCCLTAKYLLSILNMYLKVFLDLDSVYCFIGQTGSCLISATSYMDLTIATNVRTLKQLVETRRKYI